MRKILKILLFIFMLSQCGLPAADDLEDLNPPQRLTVGKTCVGSTLTFDITFYGFNNEDFFSGYNVYLGESYTGLPSVVASHISYSNNIGIFNTTVERKNILRNVNNSYPSISTAELRTQYPNFSIMPTEIKWNFQFTPIDFNYGNLNFINGNTYYFAVTAVSQSKVKETTYTYVQPADGAAPFSCP